MMRWFNYSPIQHLPSLSQFPFAVGATPPPPHTHFHHRDLPHCLPPPPHYPRTCPSWSGRFGSLHTHFYLWVGGTTHHMPTHPHTHTQVVHCHTHTTTYPPWNFPQDPHYPTTAPPHTTRLPPFATPTPPTDSQVGWTVPLYTGCAFATPPPPPPPYYSRCLATCAFHLHTPHMPTCLWLGRLVLFVDAIDDALPPHTHRGFFPSLPPAMCLCPHLEHTPTWGGGDLLLPMGGPHILPLPSPPPAFAFFFAFPFACTFCTQVPHHLPPPPLALFGYFCWCNLHWADIA